MFCKNCGKKLTDGIEVCAWCGHVNPMNTALEQETEKKENMPIMKQDISRIHTPELEKSIQDNVIKKFLSNRVAVGALAAVVVVVGVIGVTLLGSKSGEKDAEKNVSAEDTSVENDVAEDMSDSANENIEEYTQKDLKDVDSQKVNTTYEITIEEAQKNKKLITAMDYDVVFMYENKIYGLGTAEAEMLKTNLSGKSIVQIEQVEDSFMILDSEGGVSFADYDFCRIIDSKGYYVYYKDGLDGARDIYAFMEDGKCLICNDFYDYSKERAIEVNVENIKSMIGGTKNYVYDINEEEGYGLSGTIDIRLLLKKDGTVTALKSELLSDGSGTADVESIPVWNIDKKDFKLSIDLSDWTNIECLALHLSNDWVAGLKSDGTVVFSGNGYPEDALKWKNIVDIKAVNDDGIIGLQADGTLICSDNLIEIKEKVKGWKNIQMFYAVGDDRIAAVSKEGICYLNKIYTSSNIVVEYKDSEYIVEEMDKTEYLDLEEEIEENGFFYLH